MIILSLEEISRKWQRKVKAKGFDWAEAVADPKAFDKYVRQLARKLDLPIEQVRASTGANEYAEFARNVRKKAIDYDRGVFDPEARKRWKDGMRSAFGGD